MNIKHIQYIVEIERVRSISQAAENLFIGQPNLSRVLKEVEEDVGFPIFIRTTHGVRPTERGETFLQHARNILREMESIQMMSPNQMVEDRLRICIPRSTACFNMVTDYLQDICKTQNLNVVIRECHAKKALEHLSGGHAEIGIIRFREGYSDYFQELASNAKLSFQHLRDYDDVILMHKDHPLAQCETIKPEMLKPYLVIAHGDNYFMPQAPEEKSDSQIYTVDRLAQLRLLQTMPNSYMWSVPQNEKELEQLGVVQKMCCGCERSYQEALVYNHQHAMNSLETSFIERILAYYLELNPN